MIDGLSQLSFVHKIYPSDANYLLVKTDQPKAIYNYLVDKQIIVRDRSSVALCEGCLRITIGSPDENNQLMDALAQYNK